ncbi:MAG: transposase [candidate division WOR-3 bacterium]
MVNLNPNNIIPFGIDPSRANLTTVSIIEKPTLFNIKNAQRGHKGFLNKVTGLAQKTGKMPVFAVEGNSPFAIGFEFQAYRKGYPVYEITPYELNRMRDILCGEDQDDFRDAKTAAMIITQVPQLLRPAEIDLKQFAIKRLVKARLRLVKDQTRDINLLHSLLAQIWGPDYKEFFSVLNSPQALQFFANFPTPEGLKIDETEILNRLRAGGLSYYRTNWGKKRVKVILEMVKELNWVGDDYLNELGLEVAEFAQDALRRLERIKALEARLIKMAQGWKEKEIELVRTIPGFNWILACSVVALIGDLRRFAGSSDFIAYCGLVLCEKKSGKKEAKKKRKRRNKLLSHAFQLAAVASLQGSKLSQASYQKKLNEGRKKKQAQRALTKKLAEIVYAILKNKEPYDEKRHSN